MLQSPLRSPLNAVVKDVIAHPGNRLPFNKFISALLSKSGRVAAYYGESWDEILAYNAVQVAAGTPANCVAFEDSAGTIPLVAPLGAGKGCGLLKDRSGGGNHRIQTSATARGEMSRRVNLLTKTEQFEDVVWIPTNITPTLGQSGISGVSLVAMRLAPTTTSGIHGFKSVNVAGRGVTTHSVYLKADGYSKVGFKESGTSGWFAAFDLSSATVLSSTPGSLPTIQSLDGGWCRISFSPVTVNAAQAFDIRVLSPAYTSGDTNASTFAGDGVSGVLMCGPQMEDGQKALPYQRVTSASDYDEEGFPARWKLKTDDWAKSSISPVGANRAFVLTAMRVNSSASLGVLAEYGPTAASTDGTFSLESLSSEITLRVRGASAGTTVSASVADSVYVVVGALIDLASPRQELFINGVSAGVSTAAIGSTTFVARDLFVAARNGASSFANADSTAPLMAVFMQPGDPGLTSAEISRLTAQFKKSIAGY